MNRTDAPERRGGQPTDLGTTLEVNDYDLIPSRMVGQRNAACQCHEITGTARRIEPGKFCTCREIVQGQLIASGDSGDLRCLSECIQTRQNQSETGTA
jgi:hypothetical protein